MVDITINGRSRHLVIPEGRYHKLPCHLFPGDADEHGAVIAAGIMSPAE